MKKALIYLRVSTEGQSRKENSIPTQKEACLNHAHRLGYDINEETDIYIDAGESGRTDNRKSFKQMTERLETDSSVEVVIAYDISRIFRNGVEYFMYKERIEKKGKRFVSVTEPLGEQNSPATFMMEWMLAGFAEFRSRQDGEKIRTAMKHKAEAGVFPGRAPFGYRNVRGEEYGGREKRWIEVNESEAIWVNKIFEMFATGKYSIATLREELAKQRFPSRRGGELSTSSLFDILKNTIYIGHIDWGGIKHSNGVHEKIINEALFYKVQSLISSHSYLVERRRKHSFPLRGFVFCDECGSRINAAYHRGCTGKVYAYYSCQKKKHNKPMECFQEAIPCQRLENDFFELLKTIQLNEQSREAIKNKILVLLNDDKSSNEKIIRTLRMKKEAIERKKHSLLEKYIAEKIDDRTYNEFNLKLEEEYNWCLENIAKAEHGMKNVQKVLDTALGFLTNCSKAYENASPEDRKALCNAIFERIGVSGGGISSVRLKHPQAFILKKKVAKNPLFQYQYNGGP